VTTGDETSAMLNVILKAFMYIPITKWFYYVLLQIKLPIHLEAFRPYQTHLPS